MKYLKKIVLMVSVLCSFNACTDLEEDTSGALILDSLTTEREVEASLVAIYRQLTEAHQAPHFLRIGGYGADDLTTWKAGNKAPLRVFDRFDYGNGENSDINWLPHGWNNYWRTIYFSNTLIEVLKTSTAPEEVIAIANAEAHFFRALCYLNLVRTYGNVPIILDGQEQARDQTRATVLENYELIESDLMIAEAGLPLPGETKNLGRVSISIAKTVLADLYLTWGGWPVKDESKYELAANKAKEVIDLGYHTLLPIEELWKLENENSTESIFSIQFSNSEDFRSGYPTAFSFHQARGFSDAFPELQFFRDFPEGPRKEATFATEIPNRRVRQGALVFVNPPFIPWEDSDRAHPMYQKFTLSADETVGGGRINGYRAVELYRYAEVLLIYAEAQARAGQNGSSIEALNQVKRRAAGLPYLQPNASVDVTTATPDEIVEERGWELAGEYKRWFDLVRTEKVEEIAVRRDPDEDVSLVRQPSKLQYIAPIPFREISTSNLKQNPEGFVIQ
ncbi:RagB/SusD family nutrient uptake outer membrane protein [Aquimarina aggregata]|uniref:RagB/SusD family nutrient uptake outer membrane protein n=1 Tax=Aquimarina aggregata TaxID=1642818 RepID=UPI0024938F53|nr:RagB/SusD family nutrient uptake outer membrane protein [Aquimarina aggregata]